MESLMLSRFLRHLSVLALIIVQLGTGIVQSEPPTPASGDVKDPVIVIARRGSLNGPDPGLLVAIWSDGQMLCRSRPGDLDSDLVLCECHVEDIGESLKMIDQSGLKDYTRLPLPLESSALLIRLKLADAHVVRLKWTEDLTFWTNNPSPKPQFVESVRTWFKIRGAIWRISPIKMKSLDANLDKSGRFRGYNPKNPFDIDWMY